MRRFLRRYIEDVLIVGGMLVITAATFLLSHVAALYVAGAFLLSTGLYLAKHPPGSLGDSGSGKR